MPVHQIPPRIIKFGPAKPAFPNDVELVAELVPKELFGAEDLTGRLTVHPQGSPVQMSANLFHGGFQAASKGRLQTVKTETSFFDMSMTIEANIARITGRLSSEEALLRAVHVCTAYLPAFLASSLAAPVDIDDLYGNVGSAFFQVEVKGTFERVISVLDTSKTIADFMAKLQQLPEDSAGRVFAAQRYLNQAQWLGYSARHPQQFAGERVLNLHKAVEVLYPHSGEVNKLRSQLSAMGLREDVVELFASLAYIRNSVDVGHPKVGVMGGKEHDDFHLFLVYMTQIVTWLVNHTVERLSQVDSPTVSPSVGGSDLAKTMSRVGDLLKKVEPLQPNSFFKPQGASTGPSTESQVSSGAAGAKNTSKKQKKKQ
ncbi:uncharacterized protein SOCE26_078940 [Sorangium cellulosum]|uniref:Uncharacterized protein n=1 Tax=Sorangium cellulosum TaxID=56 RepID=A0A2L0F482_SORCE|nr:hypothetical protein [Sorangium cellulosum]AUX46388.1 uncharacterized protein SOCE26_078940 [Sorangium cellulosum]